MKLTVCLAKYGLLERVQRVDVDETIIGWRFVINRRASSRYGYCNYTDQRIETTCHYYNYDGTVKDGEEDDHINTLLHEVAHVIAGKDSKSHGSVWKAIMRRLGANPRRCGKSTILNDAKAKKLPKKPKHHYCCKDCDYVILTFRRLKNLDRRYHPPCRRKSNNGRLTHRQLR